MAKGDIVKKEPNFGTTAQIAAITEIAHAINAIDLKSSYHLSISLHDPWNLHETIQATEKILNKFGNKSINRLILYFFQLAVLVLWYLSLVS